MTDPDKYWQSVVDNLRRAQGMCPLTPEEAEAAFDSAPEMPLSRDEIRRMTEAAVSGKPLESIPNSETHEWDAKSVGIDEENLQLCRNEGDPDEDTSSRENELEDKLLDDNEPKEGGMEENSEPPDRGG